jgi:hypothetical protein
LINAKKWDVVILQDQSEVPAFRREDVYYKFVPGVKSLVSSIHQRNPLARIIYFVTWAHQHGDPLNCLYYPLMCDFEGMTRALLDGYTQYMKSTGGTLAKVGCAWRSIVDDKNSPINPRNLWQGDDSHPTLIGSYLAAATLFTSVFGRSAIGLDHPSEISDQLALYLQQKAGKVGTAQIHVQLPAPPLPSCE